MAFSTFTAEHHEPFMVMLIGPGGSGKTELSVALARYRGPAVVWPMDQRFGRYQRAVLQEGTTIYPVTPVERPLVWNNEDQVLRELRRELRDSDVQTLIVDSVTPRLRELLNEAQTLADATPEERKRVAGSGNKVAVYKAKALFMDKMASLANFGLNTIWIGHTHLGRDNQAVEVTKTSIPETELLKFTRNLNWRLRTLGPTEEGWGVQIDWVRDRPSLNGQVLYDKSGRFAQIWPELARLWGQAPVVGWESREVFANPDEAVALAMEQTVLVGGVPTPAFKAVAHAKNAYDKLKAEVVMPLVASAEWKAEHEGDNKAAARTMAVAWREEVSRRLHEILTQSLGGEEEQRGDTA